MIRAINLIWSLFEFSGFSKLLWFLLAIFSKPVIFCYHRISEEKLESHIKLLRSKFVLTSLYSLLDEIYKDKNNHIRGKIAFTMDDCYSNNFFIATKVFSKFKIPCTFFVPTDYSRKSKTLWAKKLINLFNQINEKMKITINESIFFESSVNKEFFLEKLMNKYLWNDMQSAEIEVEVDALCEINSCKKYNDDLIISKEEIKNYLKYDMFNFQSHTSSHPKLLFCSDEEIIKEFLESKNYLYEITGLEQNIICYPYGSEWHIGESYKIAENYYDYGLTLKLGCLDIKQNKMMIPRVPLYEKDTSASIFGKILLSQFK